MSASTTTRPPEHHGRSLHLIDLDDLVGPHASLARVKDIIDAYLEAANWEPDDHVVVAADCGSLGDVAFELDTGWRLLAARGSDRALLPTTEPKLVARRYDRLIVGSGHFAFTGLVEAVNRLHGDAWVVAHDRSLDRRLRRAASWVVTLPDETASPALSA